MKSSVILALFLTFSNLLYSQTVKVIEVLDGNLFRLQNGQVVRLSEIYVPSVIDTNYNLISISGEIKEWSNQYFEGRSFKIRYNKTLTDSTKMVYLYRSYPSGKDEDVATLFLKNGYAAFTGNSDLAKQYNYSEYEAKAKDSHIGIWSLIPPGYFANFDSSNYFAVNNVKNSEDALKTKLKKNNSKSKVENSLSLPIYKDPTLAGILSFITPGLGQIYNKEVFTGVLYLGGTCFCYSKFISSIRTENSKVKSDIGYLIAGAVVHVLSIIDAANGANRYNEHIDFAFGKIQDNYCFSLRFPL